MARRSSSRRWLREHFNDAYVQRSWQEGYRSRAVYKLQEIDTKDRLLGPGRVVVDLGAAPGGWSQFAAKAVGASGVVIALDVLPMAPLPGVEFIQGDFHEPAVIEQLVRQLQGRPVDLVLSDMAPNSSGIKAVDQPRAMHLAELAVEFASQQLKPGGDVLVKVFQGEGFDNLLLGLRQRFGRVVTRKPQASRARSAELYLVARNYGL